MKRIILIAATLLTGAFAYSQAPNTWTQKSDLGYDIANFPAPTLGPRVMAVGFSIGNKGYLGTGGTRDFWEYDPATNIWVQKADFGGTARSGAVGFSIGNKGYIGTGGKKDFWEYDPVGNTWTKKAAFGGGARSGAVGFSIGTKGYIGTGGTKDFWEYDPSTNLWTQKADFGGIARSNAVGFRINSKGYIGTGYDINGIYKKDFWEYDPSTNLWTQKTDFGGNERDEAVGFGNDNKGYIGTGYYNFYDYYNHVYYYNDFWEYDPVADNWTQKANIGDVRGRADAFGFSIGDKGYIGTGYYYYEYGIQIEIHSKAFKDFWEYDFNTDIWTQKKDIGGNGRYGAVGFGIGNKGYLGTGYGGSENQDFWEFDSANKTWTQKADFGGGLRVTAVGFSLGNKGYVGMGYSSDDGGYKWVYNDFWEYDPASNTWTQKSYFKGDGRAGAVGFSIGSKGYLGTGYYIDYNSDEGNTYYYYNDFWEYDPGYDSWTQKADFEGTERSGAVGFSIGSKGYLGTGKNYANLYKDFWEYNPELDIWTQKANFGGTSRSDAAGFSIGNKGYLGTGFDGSYKQDFWEYDPALNIWMQNADFGGTARSGAVGFSISNKGYLGTGSDVGYKQDFWEYTPDVVLPLQLISFTAALQKNNAILNWQTTGEINTAYFNIQRSYTGNNFTNIAKQNAAGSGLAQQYSYSDANVTALQQPTIFYRLQMVDKDGSYTYSNIAELRVNNSNGSLISIYPNPNKGSFTMQMHLPDKSASTTLSLYNNLGAKVWQQDAGILSGSVSRNIALENKLSAGVYVMMIQHGDIRLMQKVFVIK